MAPAYTDYDAWAADPDTEKVTAWIGQALDPATGATVTIHGATADGYHDGASYYRPMLRQMPSITREAMALPRATGELPEDGAEDDPSRRSGSALASYGRLELVIEAGEWADTGDSITQDELLGGYEFGGQPAVVRFGGPDLAWAAWKVIFTGFTGRASYKDREASLPLVSRTGRIAGVEMPPNELANDAWPAWEAGAIVAQGELRSGTAEDAAFFECTTGGACGATEPTWNTTPGATTSDGAAVWKARVVPDAAKGRPRPVRLGPPKGVPLILMDEASHLYLLHDYVLGAIQSATIYVDGLAAGGATVDLTHGWVRFASDPGGQVTADVQGLVFDGGYRELPGELLRGLLELGGAEAGQIDTAAFDALDAACPWPLALDISNRASLEDAIQSLLCGLPVELADTLDGKFTCFVLTASPGVASYSLGTLERLEDGFAADPVGMVAWRCTVRGDEEANPISNPAAGVAAARRERIKEQWREETRADQTVRDLYPELATTLLHESCLTQRAHMAAAAQLWLNLLGEPRLLLMGVSKARPFALNLGDAQEVVKDRFGLDAGVTGQVLKIEIEQRGDGVTATTRVFK